MTFEFELKSSDDVPTNYIQEFQLLIKSNKLANFTVNTEKIEIKEIFDPGKVIRCHFIVVL